MKNEINWSENVNGFGETTMHLKKGIVWKLERRQRFLLTLARFSLDEDLITEREEAQYGASNCRQNASLLYATFQRNHLFLHYKGKHGKSKADEIRVDTKLG